MLTTHTQVMSDRFEVVVPSALEGWIRLSVVDQSCSYRIVACYGWTSVVYNHITFRIPETSHFLINPFLDEVRGTFRASDLIRIDILVTQFHNLSGQ